MQGQIPQAIARRLPVYLSYCLGGPKYRFRVMTGAVGEYIEERIRTVGMGEDIIRRYVRHQEKEEKKRERAERDYDLFT